MQRRSHPRAKVGEELATVWTAEDGEVIRVRLLDISISGTALVAPRSLGDIEDELRLRLLPRDAAPPMEVVGIIRHVCEWDSPGPEETMHWLHGVRFEVLSPVAWIFINRYVDERLRPSGALDARWITAVGGILFWGELYLAIVNGYLHPSEREKLVSIAGRAVLEEALRDGAPTEQICLERFAQYVRRLPSKLRAAEIYRVLDSLLQMVAIDGEIDRTELNAFEVLAAELGVNKVGSDLIVKHYLSEVKERVTMRFSERR